MELYKMGEKVDVTVDDKFL